MTITSFWIGVTILLGVGVILILIIGRHNDRTYKKGFYPYYCGLLDILTQINELYDKNNVTDTSE